MKKINKKKLNSLLDKGAKLIDMRSPVDYRDSSIEGSVNLPFKNFLTFLIKHDKKIPIALIVKSFEMDKLDIEMIGKYADQLNFEKLHVIEFNVANEI